MLSESPEEKSDGNTIWDSTSVSKETKEGSGPVNRTMNREKEMGRGWRGQEWEEPHQGLISLSLGWNSWNDTSFFSVIVYWTSVQLAKVAFLNKLLQHTFSDKCFFNGSHVLKVTCRDSTVSQCCIAKYFWVLERLKFMLELPIMRLFAEGACQCLCCAGIIPLPPWHSFNFAFLRPLSSPSFCLWKKKNAEFCAWNLRSCFLSAVFFSTTHLFLCCRCDSLC